MSKKNNHTQSIKDLCMKYIGQNRFTHAAVLGGILSEKKPRINLAFSPPGDQDNRFDLASLTKALVTTPLVFKDLYLSGVDLDSSVSNWLKHKKTSFSKHILELRIDTLLAHTSGLADWLCLWVDCLESPFSTLNQREKIIWRLNNTSIDLSKKEFRYSDLGFILLGLCLEEKNGVSIACLYEDLLRNLNFNGHQLSFNETDDDKNHSISTGYCNIRGQYLKGCVHDENSSLLNGKTGHAGLFGTAEDIAGVLRNFLNSPWGLWMINENKNRRVPNLSDKSIGLCGWHQGSGESSFPFARGQAIGHLGFTGTAFWLEPETLIYGIVLTNRVISGRFCGWITNFRKKVFYHLYQEIIGE